ncbi:MAG TPA: hypothetical protein VFU60_02335 [Ktedonobacterales bacterium]|nr:hypothetical protein [Ktedonobacterales bacterium]
MSDHQEDDLDAQAERAELRYRIARGRAMRALSTELRALADLIDAMWTIESIAAHPGGRPRGSGKLRGISPVELRARFYTHIADHPGKSENAAADELAAELTAELGQTISADAIKRKLGKKKSR